MGSSLVKCGDGWEQIPNVVGDTRQVVDFTEDCIGGGRLDNSIANDLDGTIPGR